MCVLCVCVLCDSACFVCVLLCVHVFHGCVFCVCVYVCVCVCFCVCVMCVFVHVCVHTFVYSLSRHLRRVLSDVRAGFETR